MGRLSSSNPSCSEQAASGEGGDEARLVGGDRVSVSGEEELEAEREASSLVTQEDEELHGLGLHLNEKRKG